MQQTDEKAANTLRLETLEIEHRDLDEVIKQLSSRPHTNQLLLKRMKKRKLLCKDAITKLKSKMIPDLNA